MKRLALPVVLSQPSLLLMREADAGDSPPQLSGHLTFPVAVAHADATPGREPDPPTCHPVLCLAISRCS